MTTYILRQTTIAIASTPSYGYFSLFRRHYPLSMRLGQSISSRSSRRLIDLLYQIESFESVIIFDSFCKMLNSFRKFFAKLPNLRGKQRIQKVLDLNLGPIPVKARRTAGRLLIYPSSVQDSYFWLASTDNNPDLVAAINSLPTNGVFVDIGANIGFYSLMAANRLIEQGTVLSFEPSDREYTRLFWAKQCNKYECIWITLNAAVGDSGVKGLDTGSGHTGMNRFSIDNDNRKKNFLYFC